MVTSSPPGNASGLRGLSCTGSNVMRFEVVPRWVTNRRERLSGSAEHYWNEPTEKQGIKDMDRLTATIGKHEL